MGIEIRPAAVMAMLDEKAQKFDVMKETFSRSKQAMSQFINDDTLRGEAYSAARERSWYNLQAIDAFELSVDRSKQIDSQFKSIIEGTWGAMEEVSEDYWVNERLKVIEKIHYFQSKAEQAQKRADADPTNFVDRARAPYYQMQVEAYKNALRIPDEMIRKIHDYCSQTDGLYNDADLNALDESLNKAISTFNNAKFNPETKTWAKMDTSCFEDMAKNVEKVQETYNLKLSETEDTVVFSADCNFAYYKGKKYNLDNEDEFEEFDKEMRKEDFDWLDSLYKNSLLGIVGTTRNKALVLDMQEGAAIIGKNALNKAGILEAGTMSVKGGYATFKGYKMADGAGRMLTRCKYNNIKSINLARAARINASCESFSAGVGSKMGGAVISGIFAVPSAIEAFNKEYDRGFYLPEDRRVGNAEASTLVSIGKSGASFAGGSVGTTAGAIIGSFICPGLGTVVGGIVGGLFVGTVVGTVYDGAMASDPDGNGKSVKSDFQDVYNKSNGFRQEAYKISAPL